MTTNNQIITEFEKLLEFIKIQIEIAPSKKKYTVNLFRLKQLTNALNIIKQYPNTIKSGKDLAGIKGIGSGTVKRIDEILKTGKLSEIKLITHDKFIALHVKELEKIHGIGHEKAYELVVKHGITNIDQLKKAYLANKVELNNIVIKGLKYHGTVLESISRENITQINDYLLKQAKLLDKKMTLIICGSYRRQMPKSSDIDILITHPDAKTKKQIKTQKNTDNLLVMFVNLLIKNKFIIDSLTDKDYRTKYMGYCQYNKSIMRIDIRYVPISSYYPALLYFTGSGTFNQKIRMLAESLGYLLNEYGLYKLVGGKKIAVEIRTEEDIFNKLGLDYLEPSLRN